MGCYAWRCIQLCGGVRPNRPLKDWVGDWVGVPTPTSPSLLRDPPFLVVSMMLRMRKGEPQGEDGLAAERSEAPPNDKVPGMTKCL